LTKVHDLSEAISKFGAATKKKLANKAISGAPEDQLRGPLDILFKDIAQLTGIPSAAVVLVGERTLSELSTRPDYAVTVHNALIGFIEIKAPGKGADPRKFTDDHDKRQWAKLKSLPNLLYSDGNSFSLWRDGRFERAIAHLSGDVENAGTNFLEVYDNDLRKKTASYYTPPEVVNAMVSGCRLLTGCSGKRQKEKL